MAYPPLPPKAKSVDEHDDVSAPTPLAESSPLSAGHAAHGAENLPAKPVSALEESRKKGFYPISWRVIGGGVMMGGKRAYTSHLPRFLLLCVSGSS